MSLEDSYVAGNPRLAGSPLLTVLSGCSGSGKSSLLEALEARGHPVQPEAGRQIVKEQLHIGGDALPWIDVARFVELLASRAMYQFNTARPRGRPVIFDRSLVDAVSYLEFRGLPVPVHLHRATAAYRYAPRVFMTPPWEAIFEPDPERRKSFGEAVAEYDTLVLTYRRLGYGIVAVPRLGVSERVAFVTARLSSGS